MNLERVARGDFHAVTSVAIDVSGTQVTAGVTALAAADRRPSPARRALPRRGRSIVSREWVERSTRPHCRVDERHEFGYLWWLRDYDGVASFAMAGRGGNRVVVFPTLDAVVVVTSDNFDRPHAHALTDALLDELVLPALRA